MEVTSKPSSDQSCVIQGFAVLVGIIFVIVTTMVLVAIPTEAQLFNPNVYKHALQSQDLYDQLPSLLGELMAASKTDNDAPDNAARYLSQEDFTFIIAKLFPPEWIQAQVESLIDQTFGFYNTTSSEAKIEMPLTELKARLGGEGGDQIMRQIVSSWPLCTTEAEQQAWLSLVNPGENPPDEMPECRPPNDVLDAATPQLGQMFDEMVADMPDTADLTPKYLPDPEATGKDPRPTLMAIRWMIKLSPLIAIGLLAAVTVLAVRSRKSFLGWWGALFLCVGIGTFLLAAVSGLMVEGMIEAIVAEVISQSAAGTELVVALLEVIRSILRGAGIRISILAGLSGVLGLTMAVAAFFVGGSKPKAEDPYATVQY
ncbi:MAG: hypothetical protein JXB30_01795 [Anaerolineae bacterium]|nr:hypothetical protein [Anaerolineae bacterium]